MDVVEGGKEQAEHVQAPTEENITAKKKMRATAVVLENGVQAVSFMVCNEVQADISRRDAFTRARVMGLKAVNQPTLAKLMFPSEGVVEDGGSEMANVTLQQERESASSTATSSKVRPIELNQDRARAEICFRLERRSTRAVPRLTRVRGPVRVRLLPIAREADVARTMKNMRRGKCTSTRTPWGGRPWEHRCLTVASPMSTTLTWTPPRRRGAI